MPEVSRFYGVIIKMFFNDHYPPHFHIEYGEYRGIFDVKSNKLIKGQIPKKQLKLIQAWAIIHEDDLLKNFENLKNHPDQWEKIEPLK